MQAIKRMMHVLFIIRKWGERKVLFVIWYGEWHTMNEYMVLKNFLKHITTNTKEKKYSDPSN